LNTSLTGAVCQHPIAIHEVANVPFNRSVGTGVESESRVEVCGESELTGSYLPFQCLGPSLCWHSPALLHRCT